MANDGSAATRTEAWLIGLIQTEDSNTKIAKVKHFPGSMNEVAQAQVAELLGNYDVTAQVFFVGDQRIALDAEDEQRTALYTILCAVKNKSGGGENARIGDGTKVGTNWMRDLIVSAVHDKQQTAVGGFAWLRSEVMSSQVGWMEKGRYVVAMQVEVPQVPEPA